MRLEQETAVDRLRGKKLSCATAKTCLVTSLRWLTGLEWLAAGLAAPFLTFSTLRPQWTAAVLVMLLLLWLLRWIVRREPWPLTPFNGALLLFALMVPVGIWASPVPEATLPKAAGVTLGLAVFRAVALVVRDRRSLVMGVVVFCLLGSIVAIVGLLGTQWADKLPALRTISAHIPQLIAALPENRGEVGINPNQLAGALVLYFPLAVALVVGRLRGQWVVAALLPLLAFLGLIGSVLVLTQSRSGWIGGVVGVATLAALGGLTARRRWVRWCAAALSVLLLLSVVFFILHLIPQWQQEIIANAGVPVELEEVIGRIKLAGRLEIWSRALQAVQDFPFTGCGLGAFRQVVRILYPLFVILPDTDIAHAHNIFLQTALDLGIPGLVAYLALLMVAGGVCWRKARDGGPLVRTLALGLAASLVALHVYGLTDALALGSKPAVAFWVALGLVAALEQGAGDD